jgi:hypothetical protein
MLGRATSVRGLVDIATQQTLSWLVDLPAAYVATDEIDFPIHQIGDQRGPSACRSPPRQTRRSVASRRLSDALTPIAIVAVMASELFHSYIWVMVALAFDVWP